MPRGDLCWPRCGATRHETVSTLSLSYRLEGFLVGSEVGTFVGFEVGLADGTLVF